MFARRLTLLEQIIQGVGIAAAIGIVDLVVRTHDRAGAGANCVSERPKVQLVHCLVICILADRFCDVVAIPLSFWGLSEVFLLVEDVVLSASDDTLTLDTLNGRCDQLYNISSFLAGNDIE